ncbi:KAP family NTPase [Campylobacter sp. RM16187]|uniref:KAP family NTPase n=1 Tax=Campylobacter sp. RM16187 TaxID=1660063 RepID=UPI0021B61243|nr:KAP family NTPase [Campylobacter sp. RM16187]QKG28617.1 hypothetical protein CDOMF_0329 [Campylobacter sp. RM16187]
MSFLSKEKIETRLKEILKMDSARCIVLDGKWGVGKTTFWNNFSSSLDEDFKKSIYISLFGKETIQEIKREIILQIYARNKYISEFTEKAKDLCFNDIIDQITPNLGTAIISSISFFKKKDFKDIIICFDDFERVSEKINLKDILGLISELKEQKNCHIVMILNKEKIENNQIKNSTTKEVDENNLSSKNIEEEILSKYKDKIMDYEFYYNPTPKESFELISKELICFQDIALKYFEKHNINNIRVIRRAINALNDYSKFITKYTNTQINIKENIINYVLAIAVINATNSSADIDNLIGKLNYRDLPEDIYDLYKNNANTEDLAHQLILTTDQDYYMIGKNIVSYFKTSVIDETLLKESINALIEKEKYREIKSEIRNEYLKGVLDLKYDNKTFITNLYNHLKDDKENIVHIVGIDAFILYIDTLKKFDTTNKEKYHSFAIEILCDYLKSVFDENIHQNIYTESLDLMLNFDDKIESLYNNFLDKNQLNKISSANNIIKHIFETKDPIAEQLIENIREDELVRYCHDSNFLQSAIRFLQKNEHQSKEIKTMQEKIIKAFQKISESGNVDQKFKINLILKEVQK